MIRRLCWVSVEILRQDGGRGIGLLEFQLESIQEMTNTRKTNSPTSSHHQNKAKSNNTHQAKDQNRHNQDNPKDPNPPRNPNLP